ncbi:SusC/RagA family TonB-linked outer membrane protein [Parabacteroides sp. FAFU027]|uniref:SusC/RagA family TonB-linked outer membrane protein n=1 Tax=Parabacteroides sp. FAFU027 TaxID=2922715 RepID=UPI001FAE90C1|nr:TonB-dependent receptor [Parabacteroides sp. FAFU027]
MKKFLILLVLPFIWSSVFSQNKISGIVVDDNGNPLPGVSIVEKITNTTTPTRQNATVSGLNGKFSLTTKQPQGILSFSFIGYKTITRSFRGADVLKITMTETKADLNEVVVVGYGSQKKVSVVGSISTVTTKDLVQSPAANLSNALAGRLTGLTTVQNTGQPGKDDASLYIRGRSTWVNSTPLYIVDGVERENFTQVDANEVESISILKDASATAVYGVRGANGVLIITTKRGKDSKPVVSLSAQYGLQQPTRLPNYLDSYHTALLRNEAYLNDGYPASRLPFQPNALEAFRTHSDPYHYPDVDWYKEVLKPTTPQSQYNLNVRGGTKTARYFLSAGYFNQDGLFNTNMHKDYNTNYQFTRFNFRSNLDIDVSKVLTVSVSMAARMEDTNEPGATGFTTGENQSAFSALTRTTPYETPVFQANGKPGVGPAGVNPWLQVNGTGFTQNKKDVVESSINLNYKLDKITPGLSAKALVSYDSYYSEQKVFAKQTQAFRLDSGPDEPDSYTVFGQDTKLKYTGGYMGGYSKTYLEGSLNYSRQFGKHSVTGLLLGNLDEKELSGVYIPYRTMGLSTRVTYDYNQRYLGEINMGYNGSENFARGKRFGLFPAVAAGWVISNEEFFKNSIKFIDFMKLKASYGMVGNDKIGGGRFMYSEEYSTRNGWEAPSVPSFGLDGHSVDIIYLSRIANPNLTWEKANKYNVGVEANLFNSHLTTSLDGFLEYRRDILMDRGSIPLYLGVTPPSANIGKTQNKGFEFEVKYNNKIGEDFDYWVKANYSYAKNKVVAKDEPANKISWQKEEGQSIGQFYGYQVLGFFDITDFDTNGNLVGKDSKGVPYARQLVGEAPKPGDFRYRDVNGDGVVDDRDKLPIGYSDIPVATYGFSYGFNWKGFDFSMMWQGAYNVSLKIGSEVLYEFCEGGKVQDFHEGRWAYYTDPFTGKLVDTRATATYPRLHSQSSSPDWTTNSFFLYNSSYLKLRNMEIGYTLPIKQLKKLGISQLRVYSNANNLLTLSKVKQVDPEGPGYGANRERGWNYPQLVIYNTGINVTF